MFFFAELTKNQPEKKASWFANQNKVVNTNYFTHLPSLKYINNNNWILASTYDLILRFKLDTLSATRVWI